MGERGVPSSISVAVLGASGYTGGELVRLLIEHPGADLAYLGVRDAAERSLDEIHPHLAGRVDAPLGELSVDAAAEAADFVFLALPNGHAKDLAPALIETGRRVIMTTHPRTRKRIEVGS